MENLKLFIRKVFNLNSKSKFGKTNIIAFVCVLIGYGFMTWLIIPVIERYLILKICALILFLFSFPFMVLLFEILILMLVDPEMQLDNGVVKLSWKRTFVLLKIGIINEMNQVLRKTKNKIT